MTDKTFAGLIMVVVLAILQLGGWYFNQNGALTAALTAIIGLICGSIFGFTYGLKKGK